MHVHERGSGQPIVLVHGWGAGGVTWSEQLASLADEFRVLAPDLPGFGSTPPLPRSDAAGFATAIRRLVDDRGLREVVLVGWSMGGLVALEYASRFACHALAGLAIVDVAPRARPAPDWDVEAGFGLKVDEWVRRWPDDRESVLREVTELAFSDPDLHRPEIEQLVSSALAADPDAAIEAFSNLLECDFRADLAGIDVPTLLVFGGASTSTTARDYRTFASVLPDPRLTVIPDAGHALMVEAAPRFDAELRAFARMLGGGTT